MRRRALGSLATPTTLIELVLVWLGIENAHYCWIRNNKTEYAVGACVPASCSNADLGALNNSFVRLVLALIHPSIRHSRLLADSLYNHRIYIY